MSDIMNFQPDPHRPSFMSRDFSFPDILCSDVSCINNKYGKCINPTKIKIGAGHTCEGYIFIML